jgi:hypothetical protein
MHTSLQRARLRALQQRREGSAPQSKSGEAGVGGSGMPRVRNYNVQSDNDWKTALRALAIAGVTPPVSS